MENTNRKRPTHSVYMVEGEGDKATWTELGALWAHEDGKGFNLNLKAVPLGSNRLVVRERQEKASKGTAQ